MQTNVDKHGVSTLSPAKAVVPETQAMIGKTVKDLRTFQLGSVFVVDVLGTDNQHYYIKNKQGVVEIGGKAEWDSGTKVA